VSLFFSVKGYCCVFVEALPFVLFFNTVDNLFATTSGEVDFVADQECLRSLVV